MHTAATRRLRYLGINRLAAGQREWLLQVLAMTALAVLCVGGPGCKALSAEPIVKDETLPIAASGGDVTAQATQPIARVIRRLRPRTGVMALAWSPDGKKLATMGGLQERITVWDPRTGRMLWEKVGDTGGGEALAFSNDGRLLLAPTAKAGPEDEHTILTLWDAATGSIAGRVAGPFPNQGIAWNYARRMALDREHGLMAVIAASDLGWPVAIYDTHDWMVKGTVAVEKEWPKIVAFGPGGALAVGMVGSKIALFDARSRVFKLIIDSRKSVHAIAFSPDGKYVASGSGGVYATSGTGNVPDQIRIWSTVDGKLVRSYAGTRAGVEDLSWSPDGRYLASASYDRTIRLWPAWTDGEGQIVATFDRGGAWCVAFSPDGTLLAGGASQDDAIVAEISSPALGSGRE